MSKYRGVIGKIFAKDFKGKKLYSVALRGQDGFHGAGDTPIPEPEGTFVEFEANPNNRGYSTIDMATFVKVEGEEVETSAPKAKAWAGRKSFSGGKSKEEKGFWDKREEREVEKDKRIQIQASRNTAIEFINLLLANDALAIPSAKGKKELALVEVLDKYTLEFYAKTQEMVLGVSNESATPSNEEITRAEQKTGKGDPAATAASNNDDDDNWE